MVVQHNNDCLTSAGLLANELQNTNRVGGSEEGRRLVEQRNRRALSQSQSKPCPLPLAAEENEKWPSSANGEQFINLEGLTVIGLTTVPYQ